MGFVSISIIEALCTLAFPIEDLPDILAWSTCGVVAFCLLRQVLYRRRRMVTTFVAMWLCWLAWQASIHGLDAVQVTQERAARAYEVTDKFVAHLVLLVQAWAELLLPFLSDVCRAASQIWRQFTVRQRMFICFVATLSYSIVEVVRFVRKHSKEFRLVLFHASYIVVGPAIWHLCGLLPSEWLERILAHLITTVPTFLSLRVLAEPLPSSVETGEPQTRIMRTRSRRSMGGGTYEDVDHFWYSTRKRWLSYWCCWPLLRLIEAGLGHVPAQLPRYGSTIVLLYEWNRATIVVVFWLLFWRLSVMLRLVLDKLLGNTAILDKLAGFFGTRGVWVLQVLGGRGLRATSWAASGQSWRIYRLISQIGAKLWLVAVGSVVVLSVIFVLVRLFYGFLSMFMAFLTMLLWCFAAADSSDTLTKEVEDFYNKKLAFWVLAMIWEAVTALPYIGAVAQLLTPFAFLASLMAGEMVFRIILLPLYTVGSDILCRAKNGVFSMFCEWFCRARDSADEGDEEEGDEGEEREESEEQIPDEDDPLTGGGDIAVEVQQNGSDQKVPQQHAETTTEAQTVAHHQEEPALQGPRTQPLASTGGDSPPPTSPLTSPAHSQAHTPPQSSAGDMEGTPSAAREEECTGGTGSVRQRKQRGKSKQVARASGSR